MSHEHVQQQTSAGNQHALEGSGFDGGGQTAAPPAFQLRASTPPPVQRKGGNLPNEMRSGFAASTGYDLGDVNVHYNSSAPSQVGALAYAQGKDIHLGPGQEQHLAHEAAHVVQQREGRVQANTAVNGMPVNDNKGLETEADSMGSKAMQMKAAQTVPVRMSEGLDTGLTMQRFQAPAQFVLDDDDLGAIAQHVNTAIVGLGTDEEGVYVALQKLDRDPTAISNLKTKYRTLFGTELEDDIRGDFSGSELVLALELIGIRDDPAAANTIGAGPPTTAAEWDAVVTRLETAMGGLGTDEEAIYATLIPFRRDPVQLATLKTKYETKTGRKLDEDLASEMSGSELSYALYLLNAPPPETSLAAPGITASGTDQGSANVTGGRVNVRTGDQLTGTAYDNLFSMDYTGGLANETRWLQFIWREILVTDAGGVETALVDSVTTTGGTYNLTVDPSAPNYNTDSSSATSPFYEAGFLAGRTADSTTIYDQPGSIDAKVQAQLAAGATRVVSRAHFSTFLVRDFRPMQRIDITVEFTYTSPAMPPRAHNVERNEACDSLPGGMRARLIEQYPAFSYIE